MMDSVQVFWWLVLMGGWFAVLAIGGILEAIYFKITGKKDDID